MIIFFYGEDNFRSRRKVFEIKQKYLNSDKSGSGLAKFDYEEENKIALKIINIFKTGNLFFPKRLLIVKNIIAFGSQEEQKIILNFIDKNQKSEEENQDSVIVFWENIVPRKNNLLGKFLIKNGKSQKFEKLSGVKLRSWILGEVKKNNFSISQKALEKILFFCGEDLDLIFSELKKLANYADSEMIKEEDVDLLTRAKTDANVFQLVDALGNKDKRQALKIFHRLLEKGDDPFYLLSMFFYQFRNMLRVADFFERGIRNNFEVSRASGIHPFVAGKILSQMRFFSLSDLKKIYKKLSKIDTETKTGKIEIKLALDKFVVEI